MRRFNLSALALVISLVSASAASAQIVYVQSPAPVYYAPPPPIVPVVSYSFYPPAPVVYAPPVANAYYAPPPAVAYYPPATVVAPAYGLYSAQTTTYGLGILRPRAVSTQYYYAPLYPR